MGKRKYDKENEESVSKKPKNAEETSSNGQETSGEVRPELLDVIPKNAKAISKKDNIFNIKHFRKELVAKQGQTIALTQFLQVCLNPSNEVDYMLEYLNAGGNSHEILRQISPDSKKNLTLATPTFHLFHLIILKVQSSLPHMISITEEACRYFLNTFMPTVEIMISENSGPRHRKIVLNLLTSIVTLNPDLGIEVLNQAPLNPKNLHHILDRQGQKDKDNVRTAFVHFATSFLVDGHLPLIKALLEKQGLLPLVIPGLIQDDADAVLMFLNILKNNVIENAFVSKSLKLKTFGHQVLHNMFKIFSWKGPPELSAQLRNESKPEIMSLLSDIILTLFTSHRLGLYFTDKLLGTSDANKNSNLYKAMLSLKRPWENPVECEAVLQIIYKCPDLHRALISVIEQSFEPQHSPLWERTVNFVIKLLDKLKPEDMILRMEHLSSMQGANFVRFVTLPIPLLKFIQTNIGKDQTISFYCVKMLVKMLQALRRYMQILEIQDSHINITDLKNRLEYFIPKHLPTPLNVVSLIHDITNDKEDVQSTQDYTLQKPDKSEALIYLVDLLILYSDIHPVYFESLEGNLNIKKILDYSCQLTEGCIALLKFKIVSLWLILDGSATSLKNPMFKDLFHIILEVYTSEHDNTWIEAKETLRNFFKSTAIFEGDEDEIDLILYTLRNCKVEPTSVIGNLVEYVLKNGKDLLEYIRTQIVHFEMADESSEASLDKLFNDLMENRNTEDSIFLENKIPSTFVVGCVQYMQSSREAKRNLKHFLSLFVTNLLHSNYSPELTEVLIGDSKLDTRNYVASWIGNPISLPEMIFENDKIITKLSKTVIEDEDLALNDIFTCLIEVPCEESEITIKDISYKINIMENIDNSEIIIWSKYLTFCMIRLTNLKQLKQSQQQKISNYMKCIIAICKKHHMLDVCRNIIKILFKNRHFLKIYKPLEDGKHESSILATKFLIQIVTEHKDLIVYLDKKHSILKSYQQKNYNDIIKALIKINKKKNLNSDHTLQVLEVIGIPKKEDLLVMKHIFNVDIEAYIKDDKEPSLALEVLKIIIEKYSRSTVTEIPQDMLRKCLKLYFALLNNKDMTAANLTNLENALIKYFENKPHQAVHVNADFFKKFFDANTIRKSTSNLMALILKLNIKLCSTFYEELKKPAIISQRELTLPLGNAILCHTQFLHEHKDLLSSVYTEYKTNILKVLEKPHKAGQIYISSCQFVRYLIFECMEIDECKKFFNKTHKFEAVEMFHLNLMQAVFMKLCLSEATHRQNYLTNYLTDMLQLATFALKENKEFEVIQTIVANIYTTIEASKTLPGFEVEQKDGFKKITESSVWQNFCKAVLKDSLKVRTATHSNTSGPQLLYTLTLLVRVIYPSEHQDIEVLFDMVTSHSEFLNVMLSHHSSDVKSRLIEFIFELILKNKSVMKMQQIPVFLSAYHATRSPCDRLILAILHHYESSGLPVNEYKPYVWGDSAANYYAVRKNRTSSLWGHPTPNQVLNLFERDIIERTIRNFPVTQKLTYHYELLPNVGFMSDEALSSNSAAVLIDEMSKDKVFKLTNIKDTEAAIRSLVLKTKYKNCLSKIKDVDIVSSSHLEEDGSVYDPVFVFSLLSHLVAPGSVASCFKLLRTGVLALPVVALSSQCAGMRAAAYHVLHRFWMLLETETRHKNDKLFLTDFITTLRQSLTTAINADITCDLKNPRLPAIDALYLARGLTVATMPSDPLYKPVNNFLIAKQFVDLTLVPDFLSLFHDSDVEAAERRAWILEVIRDGVKTMTDVNVIFKTMCLKMIMDFYSSVLCDRKTKEKILGVVESLVSIPRCCDILIEGYGLMSWLHGVVRHLKRDEGCLVYELVKIVNNMIHSLKINSFSKYLSIDLTKNAGINDFHQLKINKDIENELLNVLHNLLYHVDDFEVEDIKFYVKVFSKLSKRAIKTLNKKQIGFLINRLGAFTNDSDNLEVLKKVVIINNAAMLKCSKLESYEKSSLISELATVVDKYIC